MTGRENIRLNAILLGLRKKELDRRIDKIIEFSELGDFIDEPIRVYSSGMLAKLGFSVITQVDPDVLIIDEVLAVGDWHSRINALTPLMNLKRVAQQSSLLATAWQTSKKCVTRLFGLKIIELKWSAKLVLSRVLLKQVWTSDKSLIQIDYNQRD